jgi:antitoxin component YwqK of YwqJK toxin-antitoxin module
MKMKDIILGKFNTLKYMDNNIANIIEDYIQGYFEDYNRLGKVKARYRVKYGIRNGEYKEWYTNGVLRVDTTYKNGMIHGEYKEYWSNKRLMIFCIYKEGTCEWCKGSWDRAGNLLEG